MSTTGHSNHACPYLGLKDDAATSLAFPSVWNGCHRSRRIVSPNLKHQAEHCLVEKHQDCMVFQNQQAALPLPNHLRAPRSRAHKPGSNPRQTSAFILIGLMVLVVLGWGVLTPGLILPTATETPSPTMNALMTPAVTATATLTRTPTPTMTITPSPTLTGEAVSKHQLDLPIGSEYQFVIHRVLYGENFNQYAARYNTSVEAIVLVNYGLITPVWVDTLVIIPVEFTDVGGLPAFEAYEVTQAGRSVEALAQELGVDTDDLKHYNAIGDDESLSVGDWLLVPRPRTAP